ncbi:hypothetical protein [Streptomyces sp. NPDC048659]|uniref:hypothetical protein n=1 Tax=Streptomyces sp. NPDC048659 TaxID=3155489 RepID=UPI00342ACFDA
MRDRPRGRGVPDPASSADAFVGRLLDRADKRFGARTGDRTGGRTGGREADPVESTTADEIAVAWSRVRAKPGRLSTKTRDEWSRIETFAGRCGFGWFLVTALIAVLYVLVPASGWSGTVTHAAFLVAASLTLGLTVTRLAAYYSATAAVSRGYASNRRIRVTRLLLGNRALPAVALATAPILYVPFNL